MECEIIADSIILLEERKKVITFLLDESEIAETTVTTPTGVSKGYRVAIYTSSVMAIKEYNGSSWDSENLNPYNVIPLKHSGSIQMYLAKANGPVYMGVDYGIFGKFRFMTQADYDVLASYDEDTIYFVRSI